MQINRKNYCVTNEKQKIRIQTSEPAYIFTSAPVYLLYIGFMAICAESLWICSLNLLTSNSSAHSGLHNYNYIYHWQTVPW